MATIPKLTDRAIVLKPEDDVAVAKASLEKGAVFEDGATRIEARQDIKPGHKIARRAVGRGRPVRRYGQVIGFATQDIAVGEHVHTHNLDIGELSADRYEVGVDVRPVDFYPADRMRYFDGYKREDGRVGTRNYVAIISGVNCSASVSQFVKDKFRDVQRDFPNIDGVLAVTHKSGCGTKLFGEDHLALQRVLAGYAKHPNVAAYILIGLGCEVNQAAVMVERQEMGVPGEPDGPPGKCGVSVVDFAGGYASMAALLAGLWDAQRTGVGRDIELSLLDTAVSMLSYYAIWALNRDWQPARVEDSGHQSIVPAQNFPTRDGFIVIFCNKEKFWTSLVQAMDLPEVARDPRFATFADRLAHKSVLVPILKARFAERTTAEWLSRLRGKVPCAPVNTSAEAPGDEQVAARDMIVEVKHPRFGVLREVGPPAKTEGAAPNFSPAPALGQHTDEILRTLLQYDPARIAALRASGALGEPND